MSQDPSPIISGVPDIWLKPDRLLESVSDGWVQVIEDISAFRQPQAWQQL